MGTLYLLQHLVGFWLKFNFQASYRSPVAALTSEVAQAKGRNEEVVGGGILGQELMLRAVTRTKISQIVRVRLAPILEYF